VTLGLTSPVTTIKGVGSKYAKLLGEREIFTVLDLLLHFPVTYIDFTSAQDKIDLEHPQVYRVEVENFKFSRLYRKKLTILKISGLINGQKVLITLFNQPYLFESLKKTQSLRIFGQIEKRGGLLQITSPKVFTGSINLPVLPVYKSIAGIKTGKIRKLVENVFSQLIEEDDGLPEKFSQKYSFSNAVTALNGIHLPQKLEMGEIEKLKNRFVYKEFLYFQLQLQYTRNHFKETERIRHYNVDNRVRQAISQSLSFELTGDQIKAFEDMVRDFKSERTMQRLIQGDVGSGKTVVAFLALLVVVENGYQGTVLAPTEILAQQHFKNSRSFFKKARTELITGSTPQKSRKSILEKVKAGQVDILFGTHALLHQDISFKELALVVIDEQHRFGVAQRAALYYKGRHADLLVTTATPIPRTLLLSMYNDLAVSFIKTRPKGRLPVITRQINPVQRDAFYQKIKQKIQEDEKAFIVLPLVEDSEFFSDLRSLDSEAAYFQEQFRGIDMALVSGKTDTAEKDRVLKDFALGKIRVLVSTTVIEVGIDVGDATIIVIEDADRYGLSQLHQLRGRVGRGKRQSYCFLIPSPKISEKGRQRLQTLLDSNDGFKIAETDLQMRGGGVISGQAQWGNLDFKVGDVREDYPVFKQAVQDAALLLKDETLHTPAITSLLENVRRELRTLNFS